MAGQWFTKNARLDYVPKGEYPLFLVTGGIIDKDPQLVFSSLSAAKAASQTLIRLFAQTLPESFNIMVSMPLVSGRITDPSTGEYVDGFWPDDTIQKLFKPFFEDREKNTKWRDELGCGKSPVRKIRDHSSFLHSRNVISSSFTKYKMA